MSQHVICSDCGDPIVLGPDLNGTVYCQVCMAAAIKDYLGGHPSFTGHTDKSPGPFSMGARVAETTEGGP